MSIELANNLTINPKISIIVPMFNVEDVISRAIESVLAQTFSDWELILVNDSSQDNTMGVCSGFCEKDSRIRIVNNTERGGAGFARDRGLKEAKGEYIAFLDGDDWYEPEYLQTLYKLIVENDCQVSSCSHYLAYANKRSAVRDDKKLTVLNKLEALGSLHEMDGLISSMLWDKLFKREFLAEFRLTEEIVVGEDYSLLVDTFENIEKIVVLNVPLYNYFQSVRSVCNFGYTEKRGRTIENYKKYTDYICDKYPLLKDKALAYLTVQELAVILSMAKNKNYDKRVISLLIKDIRKNKKSLYACKEYKFKYKLSAFLASISPKILIFIGRVRSVLFKNATN